MPRSPGILSSSTDGGAVAVRIGQEPVERSSNPGRRSQALAVARLLPLFALVLLCVALVAFAAHGASILSPTVISRSYPAWMSGPLRGLWPAAIPRTQTVERMVTVAFGLLFLAYLLVLRGAQRMHPGWIVGAIVAVQLTFLLSPPLEYTDVFNYINYARMGVVHHLNPYATLPLYEPHNDPAYGLSNWHYLLSPYGQLFTLITYALVPLGVAGSFWALKIVMGLCSLGLLALVWRVARLLGRSPQLAVALVGLNPIVIVWGLGGEHNEFLMMLLVFAAIYLLIAPRLRGEPAGQERDAPAPARTGLFGSELAAGVMLVAAVGIKSPAVIFLPLALAIAPRRRPLLVGMGAAAVVLVGVSLLAFGPHLGGVGAQSKLVSPEGLSNLLGIVLGLGGATSGLRTVLTGMAAIVILMSAARALKRPMDAFECGCVTAVALIVTLGWSAPWYVLWALPFAALVASNRWRRLLLAYTAYALIACSPSLAEIEDALHFHPRADRLGREEVRYFDHLGAQ